MPLFYRPQRNFSVLESFEYNQNWPGTILPQNPQFTTPIVTDNFEQSSGWPGTLVTINTQFTTPIISDGFEPSDGWT